jgi:L-threonylcarbamoyladenylate synthase
VELPPLAQRLIKDFWPGPLTLLLPKKSTIPDLITSGLSTVALRCPKHPIALEILERAQLPLAAPSANPFGKISPTTALAVEKGLGTDLIVIDGGACDIGVESTIVDVSQADQGDEIKILRRGGLSEEELRAKGYDHITYPAPLHAQSPGTLKSHYAPNKPLFLLDQPLSDVLKAQSWVSKTGFISWQTPWLNEEERQFVQQSIALTPQGSDREAARRLFATMRLLDESPCEQILVEPIPMYGLCAAILDRLKRASVGTVTIDEAQQLKKKHWDLEEESSRA